MGRLEKGGFQGRPQGFDQVGDVPGMRQEGWGCPVVRVPRWLTAAGRCFPIGDPAYANKTKQYRCRDASVSV
jgi:hypothetical protein